MDEFYQASLEEVTKQKDALVYEVASLRGELQQARNDRDQYLSQVNDLTARVVNCDELAVKSNELEVDFCLLFLMIHASTVISANLNFPTGKMLITE